MVNKVYFIGYFTFFKKGIFTLPAYYSILLEVNISIHNELYTVYFPVIIFFFVQKYVNDSLEHFKAFSLTFYFCYYSREILTLSVRLALISGLASNSRTISVCPCSLAHMRAVDPSSSCRLTLAPASWSSLTISARPWLTANIKAV